MIDLTKTNLKGVPVEFVSKGWGYESWLVNKEEYCGKILFFKKGKRCSWHYHELKDETFYILKGKLLVHFSYEDCLTEDGQAIQADWSPHPGPGIARKAILEEGDTFYVPPGLRHQMEGLRDTTMLEISTQHFDEDSYRVLKGD